MSDFNVDRLHNSAGTGAPDFPSGMPTVGGAPIAESGTNSDGHWAKFANGTQLVKASRAVALDNSSYQNWIMPLPFYDTPGASITLIEFSTGIATLDAFQGITLIASDTTWRTPVRGPLAPAGTTAAVMLFAFGRWK